MPNITKKMRFDIFKRDSFTCQYCGRTPPVIILEVDHVIAKINGGDNEQSNLITSCFDCNRGKSSDPLDQIPKSLNELIIEKQRKTEQVRQYNRFLKAERKFIESQIEEVGFYWFDKFKKRKHQFVFGPARTPTIRTFLSKLPLQKILEAIDITFGRVLVIGDEDFRAFKYFCGVCWNMIKRDSNGQSSN